MNIKIKQFDLILPMPEYKTVGAAGLDVCARIETVIKPKSVKLIPLNIAIEVPDGYWVLIAARSSTYKQGLIPGNGIGIGDSDYKGDNDEYFFCAYNYTDEPVTIDRGQRIAQIVIMPYEQAEITAVDSLGHQDRGESGSTGTH